MSANSLAQAVLRVTPGTLLAVGVAAFCYALSGAVGGPVMVYALIVGMACHGVMDHPRVKPGIEFSGRRVLRIGVALLGLRITLGEVQALGWGTALIAVGSVVVTLGGGYWFARWVGLSRTFSILTAGAVAICGASAALAIAAVLPRSDTNDKQAILAVVGVNALSTVAMVAYPVFTQSLGWGEVAAGIFLGASIHDVAQVVGAGYIISPVAGETATLVKLIRVACLVPAVAVIAWMFHRRDAKAGGKPPPLPLFLIAFVVLVALNSTGLLPDVIVEPLRRASGILLVVAVAALGVKTSLRGLVTVGVAPIGAMVAQTLIVAVYAFAALVLVS
ncbi:MAG: putative sulfate exporter family transporter [Pseudomonadota bacterium]